jgi:hypothetical protein
LETSILPQPAMAALLVSASRVSRVNSPLA